MVHQSHICSVVFGIISIILWILNQLPEKFQVKIEVEKIIEAITILNEKGKHINSGPWPNYPQLGPHGPSTTDFNLDVMDIDNNSTRIIPPHQSPSLCRKFRMIYILINSWHLKK